MLRMSVHFMRLYGKRVVFGVVLAVMIVAFAQTIPWDMAIWLGGETLAYIDVVLGLATMATLLRIGPVAGRLRDRATAMLRRGRRRAARIAGRRAGPTSADDERQPSFARRHAKLLEAAA